MNEPKQPTQQVEIQKIYIKDVSLETPNSPGIFTENWQVETEVRLDTSAAQIADDLFEALLTVTITTKLGERTAYLAEVQQAGLFTLRGFDETQTNHMLYTFCPTMLFPFAREELSALISKAGFPVLMLNPINFDMIYAQRLQQQAKESTPTTH